MGSITKHRSFPGRRSIGRARRRLLRAVAGADIAVDSPALALTYDDGPDPQLTPILLDVLRDGGAHATFFLIGDAAERHPAIVQRMVSEGHAVGSHSMHHPDFRIVSHGAAKSDIAQSWDTLVRVAAVSGRLFRPPHGRLTFRTALHLRVSGYSTWLWNVDSYDWKDDISIDGLVANVAEAAPGSVVLMHDTYPRTIEATRRLIEVLSARGTPLVTLLARPA